MFFNYKMNTAQLWPFAAQGNSTIVGPGNTSSCLILIHLFIYLLTWFQDLDGKSVNHTEEWIKSNLSGKIKVSPAAACGDHQLILRTPAGSLQPATLCVGYPPLHQSHCYAAPLVYTASAPFPGGDRGAAKAAETITISCTGPGLAAVTGVMCRAAQSSCCFRPFKQEKLQKMRETENR